jgi:AraC-like DNA-binding protein
VKISFSIPDFLLLALVVQGLILSILLLYTSRKIKADFYISAIIFVVSETTMNMELDYSGAWLHYTWLSIVTVPLTMALGPLIYLYTRSLIFGDQRSYKKRYLHFIPLLFFMKHQLIFLLYTIGVLSIPFVSNLYVSQPIQIFLFGPGNTTVIAAFASLVIYTCYSYYSLRNVYEIQLSAVKQQDLKWLKTLLRLVLALSFIWFCSIIIGSFFNRTILEPWFHYLLYFPTIVFVYWLGMGAYIRQSKMRPDEIINYNKPIVKKYFQDKEADNHWLQLKLIMDADQIYLNPELKLDELSARLNLPVKSVSSLLNQHIGKNFNDFVNGYRVEEVKKRLINPAANRFTIASIALDCGFNSLATFQRCFKQVTGVTPSQYINEFKTDNSTSNSTQIRI